MEMATGQGWQLRYLSWLEPPFGLFVDPGYWYTKTISSGTVQWHHLDPPTSQVMLVGCPADQSIDSYNALPICFWYYNPTTIAYSISTDYFFQVLQFSLLIILEPVSCLFYFAFFTINVVNSSVMYWNIWTMPWVPVMPYNILFTLRWHWTSW
jgi:hypothetical protein